jgi:ABC-2 type transport system permease protein
MASNDIFQMVSEHGWRTGFTNLLRKENHDWWGTRRWLVQAIIWAVILNGILATLLFTSAKSGGAETAEGKVALGLTVFFALAGIAVAIGAIITGQEEVLDEKRSGTAAWILSKPVSRTAFILGKLISNAIGILIVMVLLQGAIAYLLVFSAIGRPLPIGSFISALGVLYLAVMFYFTLTLMLSTISNSRGAVIGLPIVILFAYQFALKVAPWLGQVMPWGLTSSLSPGDNSVAVTLALGQPLVSVAPIIATFAWCVSFVAIAVWRFNREEF